MVLPLLVTSGLVKERSRRFEHKGIIWLEVKGHVLLPIFAFTILRLLNKNSSSSKYCWSPKGFFASNTGASLARRAGIRGVVVVMLETGVIGDSDRLLSLGDGLQSHKTGFLTIAGTIVDVGLVGMKSCGVWRVVGCGRREWDGVSTAKSAHEPPRCPAKRAVANNVLPLARGLLKILNYF